MTSIQLAFICLVYSLLCLRLPVVSSKPCWCNILGKRIAKSTKLLVERYGKQNLNATAILWSSGRTNALANRIYHHLNKQTAFKMGLVGGSFGIPDYMEGNTWVANVTRWMDVILSSSKCESKDSILVFNNTKCSGKATPAACLNLTLTSHSNHETPVFCEPFKSDVESASYHRGNRQLEDICDTAHHEMKRFCSVYIGSGEFAQISSGAKGNTQSRYGERHVGRILDPNENLDFLFWDFSINDAANCVEENLAFVLRLVPHALKYHKNLVGFGFVYWANTDYHGENEATCYAHYENSTTDLAESHLPYFVTYFDPKHGPYRNISLITMSHGHYCRTAGCVLQDFIDLDSSHPSPMGISRFADLVIWQFLRVFRQVHRDHCEEKSHSNDTNVHTTHFSWSVGYHATKSRPFTLESANDTLRHVNEILRYPPDATSGRLSFHPDYPLEDITVVASMPFSSPVIGKPLPVDQVAILCTPGIPVLFGTRLQIAHQSVEANITGPLRWVEMDITTVLKEKCAGWADQSEPSLMRHDADHEYRPAANISCRDCPVPDWAGSDYPYGYWNSMPMVKKVDIVVRLSSKLNWTHVCFNSCKPRFLWQAKGVWKEDDNAIDFSSEIQDWIWRGPYYCKKKISHPASDFHYLWYQADTCFRSLNTTFESSNIWRPPVFGAELGVIRID